MALDRRQKVWNGLKEGFGPSKLPIWAELAGGLRQQLRNITTEIWPTRPEALLQPLTTPGAILAQILQYTLLAIMSVAIQFQSNYKSGGWGGGQIWAEGGGDHKCWVSASCSFLCNWFICRYPIAVHLSLHSRRWCLQIFANWSFLVIKIHIIFIPLQFTTIISGKLTTKVQW